MDFEGKCCLVFQQKSSHILFYEFGKILGDKDKINTEIHVRYRWLLIKGLLKEIDFLMGF